MVAVLPWIAAATGIAGAGASIFGGPSAPDPHSNIPAAQFYQPTGQGSADTQLQGFFNNYQNPYTQFAPQFAGYLDRSMNNPYAAGAMTGAGYAGSAANHGAAVGYDGANQLSAMAGNGATTVNSLIDQLSMINPQVAQMVAGAQQGGNALQGVGQNALSAAGGLSGLAQGYANPLAGYANMTAGQLPGLAQGLTSGIMPAAQSQYGTTMGAAGSVLNNAFDPMGAQYGQSFQQNLDQTRAGLAARGLDTSGTGAGIENQSNMNFNTNWQNQMLGRQQSGLSAYTNAAGSALGGLESGATSAYNPVAASLGQGLSALNTSANTGYGIQSGAATTAASLGSLGAQNIISGAAQPYMAQTQANTDRNSQLGQLGGIGNSFGSMYGQGQNLYSSAINNDMLSGQLPYNMQNNILGNQYGALNNAYGAAGNSQNYNNQMMGSLANYLGLGSNAAQGYFNAQQQGYGNFQNTVGGIGNLVGSAAYGANNMGNLFAGMGGNPYAQYGNSNTPSSSNQFANVGISW